MENSARQGRGRAVEFVQNDEKPHPKMRFPAKRKREVEKMKGGGVGLIGSTPEKP